MTKEVRCFRVSTWLTFSNVPFIPELVGFNPRAREQTASSSSRAPRAFNTPKLVAATPSNIAGSSGDRGRDRDAAFGDRRGGANSNNKGKGKGRAQEQVSHLPGGGVELSWTPSKSGTGDDSLFDDGRGMESNLSKRKDTGEPGRGKVERFGAGMEKGGGPREEDHGRSGRTKRRTNIRSGSRNTFRQL